MIKTEQETKLYIPAWGKSSCSVELMGMESEGSEKWAEKGRLLGTQGRGDV